MKQRRAQLAAKPRASRKPLARPIRLKAVYEDVAHEVIRELIKPIWRPILEETSQQLVSLLPEGLRVEGRKLGPEEADDALHEVTRTMKGASRVTVAAHDSYGWLWYLRRLPIELLAGHLATTAPYDMALAEVLSGWSTRACTLEIPSEDTSIIYPLTDDALRPVLELCSQAKFLSACHGRLRRAGKGAQFICHTDGLPTPVTNLSLEAAIDLYDKRLARDAGNALPAGTEVLSDFSGTPHELPILILGSIGMRHRVPGWLGQLRKGAILETNGRYLPHFIGLGAVASIMKGASEGNGVWWAPELPYLILLLRALALTVVRDLQWAGTNLPNAGYLILARQHVSEILRFYGPEAGRDLPALFPSFEPSTEGAALLEVVEQIAGRTWPLTPGPIVRRAGESVVLDLAAASDRLVRMLTIPGSGGGSLVNSRASSFELVTQERVDRTPWKPPDDLRNVRGRTLRLRGRALTDVDALAFRDGTLLLVSCKSFPYTLDYDAGRFSVVRNVRTNIEAAVDRWQGVIDTLRNEPRGDNYDFSGMRHIGGVVCTPHVFYVEREKDTRAVIRYGNRTLPAACSIGELAAFLGQVAPSPAVSARDGG